MLHVRFRVAGLAELTLVTAAVMVVLALRVVALLVLLRAVPVERVGILVMVVVGLQELTTGMLGLAVAGAAQRLDPPVITWEALGVLVFLGKAQMEQAALLLQALPRRVEVVLGAALGVPAVQHLRKVQKGVLVERMVGLWGHLIMAVLSAQLLHFLHLHLEVEQSASSGPAVQDHSRQLERRTNNETIHTN